MKNFNLPVHLSDKIYQIKEEGRTITKLISYFPLSNDEKQEIRRLLKNKMNSDPFSSIFSDTISDKEWENSKLQIKKKFQDELFDIDRV